MENADLRLVAVVAVDGLEDPVVVADESRDVVALRPADRIPAVVSEVVDDQIEVVCQQRPERIVEIDRQTVAVAQDQARAFRVAVTPQDDDRVIIHADITGGKRLGYFPHGCSTGLTRSGNPRTRSNPRGC